MSTKIQTSLAAAALVVAVLGATPVGHAAGKLVLPRNSVGTVQLKPSAVTGAKVQNGSIRVSAFKPGTFPTGAQGAAGPQGDTGPAGPAGDNGGTGLTGLQVIQGQANTIPSGSFGYASAQCPAGKRVVGGGWTTTYDTVSVTRSSPATPDSWTIRMSNKTLGSVVIYAQAVCAQTAS